MNIRISITKILATFFVACGFTGLLAVVPVAALPSATPIIAAGALKNDACQGLSQVDSSQGCGTDSNGTVSGLLKTAINLLSLAVGVAAVITIIIGGLKFITAQGDASAVASARTAIIYALVGLVIASLAQVLVHFVLHKV